MARHALKLLPHQQMMVDDGYPPLLFRTEEQIKAWWEAHPPVSIPFAQIKTTRNEDEATTAFRAQEDERKRLKSLAQIGKMKARFVAKANPIDYNKMRWDPRKGKFVEDTIIRNATDNRSAGVERKLTPTKSPLRTAVAKDALPRAEITPADGSHQITKDNAEAIAKLNGIWKPDYEKLRGTGRVVMTVGNVLKGLVKRGGEVKWPK